MKQARNLSRNIEILIAFILLWGVHLPAAASDLTIRLVNDPAAGNSRPDDLYTSDLQIEFTDDRRRIVFGERMFTDRQRGLRFVGAASAMVRTPPPPARERSAS